MLFAFRNLPLWLASIALLLAVQSSLATADDWPQFLGPHRNGISAETGLVDRFADSGPKILWRTAGGVGMSGLAVSDGKLLTLVQKEGRQFVIALDAKTGESKWETPVAPAYKNSMGDGPRAAPAIADGEVYVFTGQGVLASLNLADGKIQWSHDVPAQLGGKVADYGMACSPLVVEDQVVVTAGAKEGLLAGYDRKSGQRQWSSGSGPAGYSSPALLKIGGKPQIVAFAGSQLVGVEPRSGKPLWNHPYVTDYDCNIATPLAIEGGVFISSGENHGAALLQVQESGDGYAVKEAWTSQGPRSVLRNEWQTSILLDGCLYGLDNVGSAGPVTHLTCIQAKTGERMWQKLRFGKGNLIAADGKLLISTMDGQLVMVRAAPKEYEELGRAEVFGGSRQAPALAGGLLYLRDDEEIVCLDLRKK